MVNRYWTLQIFAWPVRKSGASLAVERSAPSVSGSRWPALLLVCPPKAGSCGCRSTVVDELHIPGAFAACGMLHFAEAASAIRKACALWGRSVLAPAVLVANLKVAQNN